ncbi:MAG: AarF/UbiB family protein [Acidimicrobiales bacterium]
MANPRRPDMIEVLDRTTGIDERPGLREFARLWLAWAPGARASVAAEAAALARPSWRPASLRALGRTGRTIAHGVAAGVVAEGRLRWRTGPRPPGAALRLVQEVVRAGGPSYVKLGQFISTAQGLLPDEWVHAFAWCRDTVAPLPPGAAEVIVEEAFGAPLGRILGRFDPVPIGAASIAQVHAACLPDGTEVVVKVRRPGLRALLERDLRAMALVGAAAERISRHARLANVSGFVELFATLLLEEIDLRFEAVNQVELALASEDAGHDFLTFPRPVPSLVAPDVLVMTRVPGVPYTRALAAFGDRVDGERLLRLAITGMLEHTLAYGVFHGDLHAGNVFISPEGGFSIVDFGIAGRVDDEQRAALFTLLYGFAQNDTVVQLEGLQRFGAVPPGADLVALARLIEDRLNAIDPSLLARDQPMSVTMLGQALVAVIRVLSESGFSLPKDLVLFFKNLLYLNGFAATLAPDTNLFDEIAPVFAYFVQRYPEELATIVGGITSGGRSPVTG